jgi:hypothetical protein
MNRIFLITRGTSGKKIQETLKRFGKKNILHKTWELEPDLPAVLDEEDVRLPDFSDCNLVLSYALHPDINLFIVDALKSAEALLLMPHTKAPFPPGYHVFGSLLVGVLKPCCVIPPFKNRILTLFCEEFGTPSFSIKTDRKKIVAATVESHTRCGAADFVAENLVGVPVGEAYQKAGLLAQYYCQSSTGPFGSIHDAGKVHAEAVRKALKSNK